MCTLCVCIVSRVCSDCSVHFILRIRMAVVADTRQTSANAQCRQSSCHTYTAIIYLSIIERSSIYLRFFACKSRHVAHAPADATRISQWLTNCKLLANLFDFFLSSSWSHRRWKTYVLTAEWSIDGVIHLIYYLRANFVFWKTERFKLNFNVTLNYEETFDMQHVNAGSFRTQNYVHYATQFQRFYER